MILDLPERDFDGYIFDCDGTLVDSMPLHFKAWSASFVHHGAPWEWTEDEFYANAGVPDRITVMELNERFDADLCPDSIHEFKAEWYARHLHEIEAVAAVADLARRYHAEGRRISSPRAAISLSSSLPLSGWASSSFSISSSPPLT